MFDGQKNVPGENRIFSLLVVYGKRTLYGCRSETLGDDNSGNGKRTPKQPRAVESHLGI